MRRSVLKNYHPSELRNTLRAIMLLAKEIHAKEAELIKQLHEIDRKRFFVWFGYKSLRGFCSSSLRFSRTQSQRIATQVRRFESDNLSDDAD